MVSVGGHDGSLAHSLATRLYLLLGCRLPRMNLLIRAKVSLSITKVYKHKVKIHEVKVKLDAYPIMADGEKTVREPAWTSNSITGVR